MLRKDILFSFYLFYFLKYVEKSFWMTFLKKTETQTQKEINFIFYLKFFFVFCYFGTKINSRPILNLSGWPYLPSALFWRLKRSSRWTYRSIFHWVPERRVPVKGHDNVQQFNRVEAGATEKVKRSDDAHYDGQHTVVRKTLYGHQLKQEN